ncbi:MAG: GDSL-type esterase/lipase family protein [Candidatus Aminicenantes bacterium]|nr:GDSL-type esterase/lipase family protein [Candidatus Aminicenantes bacterium]
MPYKSKTIFVQIFLLTCLFFFRIPLRLSAEDQVLKGRQGHFYFNTDGKLSALYIDSNQNMYTENHQQINFDSFSQEKIPSNRLVRHVQIKKDKANRVWIIWEQETADKNDVYIGKKMGSQIGEVQNISSRFSGTNHSPSLDFSGLNDPLVVYVNAKEDKQRLIITNPESALTWTLDYPDMPTFFSPHILTDGLQRPWVFWAGRKNGELDGIYYSYLEGSHWIEPRSLTSNPSLPHFHPAVAEDYNGHPQVVWSGFDGQDYEIFFSRWTGTQWTMAEKITDNTHCADTQPSLNLLFHTIPIVTWTSSKDGKRDIFLSVRIGSKWTRAVNISNDSKRNNRSKLITEQSNIAVMWEAEDKIFMKSLSYPELFVKNEPAERNLKIQQKESSYLRKNRFIAFGDSITFGWMGGPVPDESYIPRLEVLLKTLFSNPMVLNRGIPSEATWEAVSRVTGVITTDLSLYFFLMEGTNDVSTLDYSMATTAFNLTQIINTCIDYGVFPLISTIIPRTGDRDTSRERNRTLTLNNKIKQIAVNSNVMEVDNYSAFNSYPVEQGGLESLIFDGLHPNRKGYQLLAQTFFDAAAVIPYPPEQFQAKKMRREGVIQLVWAENSKITGLTNLASYRIYRKRLEKNEYTQIAETDATLFNYSDQSVTMNADYKYMISATNSENKEGPPSDPIAVEIGDPFSPADLKTQVLTNKSFLHTEYINKTTWTTNPENQGLFSVVKYRVYRKKDGETNDKFQFIGEVDASVFQFVDRYFTSYAEASGYVYGISSVDVNNIEGPIGTS